MTVDATRMTLCVIFSVKSSKEDDWDPANSGASEVSRAGKEPLLAPWRQTMADGRCYGNSSNYSHPHCHNSPIILLKTKALL
ncbi:hypothetical protein J6590_041271 [Homalodisca vitripennis]|nr:hypothetical protein J6590_041271 [Homalodisca vitripennis]